MKKWKTVRVKQELIDQVEREVEKNEFKNLSEFVSDAIQHSLQRLTKQRVSEYLERKRDLKTLQLQAQTFYTPKHTWVKKVPDGTVEIGVTEHFQRQLQEIVNIRTEIAGEYISKDEPFGVAESWWFTYDLYSPLNGRILAVNKQVIDDPFTLNADSSQWIIRVQPEYAEINTWKDTLLTLQEYNKKNPAT